MSNAAVMDTVMAACIADRNSTRAAALAADYEALGRQPARRGIDIDPIPTFSGHSLPRAGAAERPPAVWRKAGIV